MLRFRNGNLFDEPADIRINTVNCVGVMGKGVALQFKERYPEMFESYRQACEVGEVRPGKLHIWTAPSGEIIVNFPTKRHWRQKSRYEDIDDGLEALRHFLKPRGNTSVALPALGCGHGGLDWKKVAARIKEVLGDLAANITVFEPSSSRTVNAVERDPNWPEVASRLAQAGIRIVDPDDVDVPSGIRELFPDRVFIAGDMAALHRPIVGVVTSDDPSEREQQAVVECATELCAVGCTIGLAVSSERSFDLVRRLNAVNCYVSVVPSGSLLMTANQRTLISLGNERLAIVSLERPVEGVSGKANGMAAKTLWAIAESILLTSAPKEKNTFPFAAASQQAKRPLFVVDYGDAQKRAGLVGRLLAGQIARNRATGRPNIDPILQRVGIRRELSTVQPLQNANGDARQPTDIPIPEPNRDQTNAYPKRLIEVDLPIGRISTHARREKSIRHGHISTLHIWWARRPLAACRAVICAALWPDPADPLCPPAFRSKAIDLITAFARRVYPDRINEESKKLKETGSAESLAQWEAIAADTLKLDVQQKSDMAILRLCLLDFIADFANWANSIIPAYLETSRALTQSAHEALGGEPGTQPLVADPFAGGGSIPLEALRVGANAFASDINPIPVLLNKMVLEYIPKYGQRLADEVRKWGEWIKREAEKELAAFYPKDADGATPIAYLWARTVLSEAPGQGDVPVEIPLIRSFWVCKKPNRKIALRWVRDKQGGVETEVVEISHALGKILSVRRPRLELFEPRNESEVEKGTTTGGAATCPVTQHTMSVEDVRRQLSQRQGGSTDSRLFCVVTTRPDCRGRVYRLPTTADTDAVTSAARALAAKVGAHRGKEPLIPDGQLNHLRGFFNVVLYGMDQWGKLFSPRQCLALCTLIEKIREAATAMDGVASVHFATAVETCLALALGKQADSNSTLCAWRATTQDVGHTFARQALPMVWDFAEPNIFSGATRDWMSAVEGGLQTIASIDDQMTPGQAVQASALTQALPDSSADVTFTDPPYYAAVPYADLSDYFYSWLKRCIDHRYPDLFKTALTPKDDECVSLAHRAAMYRHKDGAWFEEMMGRACADTYRVTRPDGIGIFVFASKETAAWEAMLNALIGAGWTVTASWTIDTEMGSRLRAANSAVLASSIHIVARPRHTSDVGEWRDLLSELPRRIHEWMPRLSQEGIVGADAIFACLGPALEIFSRYSRVEKANGESASLHEYLEHVWAAVSTEALSMIFRDADAAGLEPDARITAMWLWTIGGGKAGTNGKSPLTARLPEEEEDEVAEAEADEEVPVKGKPGKTTGYILEFDAARKIAQGLGIHLEKSESIVEVKGDKARLLPVAERTRYLFGVDQQNAPSGRRRKKVMQKNLFDQLEEAEAAEAGWTELKGPAAGSTVLDRLHQTMILFAGGRGELMKRFLVEDGIGKDARFWKLAQSLSALYPTGTDEKRWVDGVLARKKGLGL